MAFTSQNSHGRLTCPKDQGQMLHADAGGIWVERCDCCGGIWLDCGELDRLLRDKKVVQEVDTGSALTLRRFSLSAVGTRKCPRDGAVLTTLRHPEQGHIEIDRCPSCLGVFLDAGELKDLADFSLSERMRALIG